MLGFEPCHTSGGFISNRRVAERSAECTKVELTGLECTPRFQIWLKQRSKGGNQRLDYLLGILFFGIVLASGSFLGVFVGLKMENAQAVLRQERLGEEAIVLEKNTTIEFPEIPLSTLDLSQHLPEEDCYHETNTSMIEQLKKADTAVRVTKEIDQEYGIHPSWGIQLFIVITMGLLMGSLFCRKKQSKTQVRMRSLENLQQSIAQGSDLLCSSSKVDVGSNTENDQEMTSILQEASSIEFHQGECSLQAPKPESVASRDAYRKLQSAEKELREKKAIMKNIQGLVNEWQSSIDPQLSLDVLRKRPEILEDKNRYMELVQQKCRELQEALDPASEMLDEHGCPLEQHYETNEAQAHIRLMEDALRRGEGECTHRMRLEDEGTVGNKLYSDEDFEDTSVSGGRYSKDMTSDSASLQHSEIGMLSRSINPDSWNDLGEHARFSNILHTTLAAKGQDDRVQDMVEYVGLIEVLKNKLQELQEEKDQLQSKVESLRAQYEDMVAQWGAAGIATSETLGGDTSEDATYASCGESSINQLIQRNERLREMRKSNHEMVPGAFDGGREGYYWVSEFQYSFHTVNELIEKGSVRQQDLLQADARPFVEELENVEANIPSGTKEKFERTLEIRENVSELRQEVDSVDVDSLEQEYTALSRGVSRVREAQSQHNLTPSTYDPITPTREHKPQNYCEKE